MLLNRSPAPTFDEPIEMLSACHAKIRHFCALTAQIAAHVSRQGLDAESAQAAASVLRYFDIAAPLHHDDEEHDLFPALRALNHASLNTTLDDLIEEHAALNTAWQAVRPWLRSIAGVDADSGSAAFVASETLAMPATLAQFVQGYPAHLAREEAGVFPYASEIESAGLMAIGQRMAARRKT